MTDRPRTNGDAPSWRPLVVLGCAQFLMVLDSAVMNVSVGQLVEDFDTEVTAIQAVITFYSLVMAATMMTGGKIGDLIGRQRAFRIGLVVYGLGSALTAAAWSVPVLLVGWSVLEGLGAAMVLPALAALVAGNYEGKSRAFAYAVLGGLAGTGVAVGPIVGGFFTATLSWRWVFVGEAIIVVVLVVLSGWLVETRSEDRPSIDAVGATLSALGLGLVVLGVLQSSSWGWVEPKNSPSEPFGMALTPFAIGIGMLLLWSFSLWQRRRERRDRDPLVRLELLQVPPLRAGLFSLLAQNTVLLGTFFTLPLYLQITQGLDAFETGLRMLPMSVAMMVVSMSGPALQRQASARALIRCGFLVLAVGAVLLVATVRPQLDERLFFFAMAVLGVGMGLLASQLGNVVQSSVGERDRSEVGGLQYTAQNLGSAVGTALAGSILIAALGSAFATGIAADERISPAVSEAAAVEIRAGIDFVAAADVASGLERTELPASEQVAIVERYEDSQLRGLKTAVVSMAGLSLLALFATGALPSRRRSAEADDSRRRSSAS